MSCTQLMLRIRDRIPVPANGLLILQHLTREQVDKALSGVHPCSRATTRPPSAPTVALRRNHLTDCRYYTLLDILSSEQFRTVILMTAGLDTFNIADLLETSEWNVCDSLLQCLGLVGCRSVDGLSHKLLYEWDNDLYDHRLEKELAKLQTAARRMLERMASTNELGTFVESRALPSAKWD